MSKEKRTSALDRAIAQAVGEGRSLGREDDPAATELPQLWQWLSRVYVGRDRVKLPATLTIRLGPEGVLITLTDRDLACSLDATCAHLGGALAAVEAALGLDAVPLRSWGKKEPQLRKRKSGS